MRRVVLLLLLLMLPSAAKSERTAMVTDLIGSVRLDGHAVKTLQVLPAGAELEVAPNARISLIFFQDSHLETLTGPCRLQVLDGEGRLVSGEPAQKSVRASTAMRLPSRGQQPETMGGTVQRSNGSPQLARPQGNPLVFAWSGSDHPWVVVVSPRDRADEQVWRSPPAEGSVRYAGPELDCDRVYTFELQIPEGGSDEPQPPLRRFMVLSPESLEQVRAAETELAAAAPDDFSARALMMEVYAERWMLEEAVEAGRAALTLRPRDEGLKEALIRLFKELNRPEEIETL